MSPQMGTLLRGTVVVGTFLAAIALANGIVNLCAANGIHEFFGAVVSIPLNVILVRVGHSVVQGIRGIQD